MPCRTFCRAFQRREEELKKESENVKELLGQVKKTASDLETSFETMVIEAFGMDETTASIQETAVKIGWTLNLINAQLTTLKDAKVTSQLDDMSVLEVKGLHQEVLAEQKLGLEKYKLELKEAFAQYKDKLKEIVHGHGVWLSNKAWVWAILIVYIVIAFFFLFGFIVARNRYL